MREESGLCIRPWTSETTAAFENQKGLLPDFDGDNEEIHRSLRVVLTELYFRLGLHPPDAPAVDDESEFENPKNILTRVDRDRSLRDQAQNHDRYFGIGQYLGVAIAWEGHWFATPGL
jgi:hypothetical protein